MEPPSNDDFPVGATDEELERYHKKKTTQNWRYKKLTSRDAAEYRAAENARVKDYQHKKKGEKDNEDIQAERQKELSRERYVKYVKLNT